MKSKDTHTYSRNYISVIQNCKLMFLPYDHLGKAKKKKRAESTVAMSYSYC